MAKRGFAGLVPSSVACFLPRPDRLWWYLALVSVLALLGQELARSSALAAPAEFEGFGEESEEIEDETSSHFPILTPPPILTQSGFETDRGPPEEPQHSKTSFAESPASHDGSKPTPKPSPFDYWDEDEFEGLPVEEQTPPPAENPSPNQGSNRRINPGPPGPQSYYIEIFSVTFLIAFAVNYFIGRRENEKIALAWAAQFATKDGIFEKNFSLLGTGDGTDTPLLLKEGQNVFKFYASGRRYCQGLLATMELQSRHDLISRIYNFAIPCKDEITIEVYMNEDGMDPVIFSLARKKAAKGMQKELKDLQQYANLLSPPSNRKWVTEELVAISESREVASDLITDTVLDQGKK